MVAVSDASHHDIVEINSFGVNPRPGSGGGGPEPVGLTLSRTFGGRIVVCVLPPRPCNTMPLIICAVIANGENSISLIFQRLSMTCSNGHVFM